MIKFENHFVSRVMFTILESKLLPTIHLCTYFLRFCLYPALTPSQSPLKQTQ